MRLSLAILCVGGVAAAQPVLAKADRAAAIVEAAQYCKVDTPTEQSLALLKSRGWKDVTPVLFGESLAKTTGSTALRRKQDSAMVGDSKAAAGANCQFDFANIPDEMRADAVARLDAQFGAHVDDTRGFVTWHSGGNSISLGSLNPKSATLMWLPAQAPEARK
ncbi:hypothetical protein [Sphingomonas koreensis]